MHYISVLIGRIQIVDIVCSLNELYEINHHASEDVQSAILLPPSFHKPPFAGQTISSFSFAVQTMLAFHTFFEAYSSTINVLYSTAVYIV